jgi:tRNA A-37 threonylcarbamoyl transferase component Bud32
LKGTRLGGYEVVRLLGHGASGSVFEATHVALGKRVAIKVLHEHLAADEQMRSRFVREGRVAARLRHPNAVDVLDVGVESEIPYLVMELLAGGDLRELLADVHLLSLEHALDFLLPIASALAQAHDLGILHRDLKPANIFLARDIRGDVVPKLVDFGLSKLGTEEGTSSLTATELVAGTLLYMAPEQTLGVKHSSPASDQYSLAAILYECITGEPPFRADGLAALVERIRTDVARPPSHLNPRIPEDFDPLVFRALQRDPAKRFPNVRAFARACLPFASAETVRALDRDFADRESGAVPKAASTPSIRKAVAEAETRIEAPAPAASDVRPVAALPCPPGASPFHIKGMAYRGLAFLVSKLVRGGLDAVCEALPDPRLSAFLRQPFLATARYDILPLLPIYTTLARLMGVPFDGLVRESSAAQCRYDVQTVFKTIWASSTVEGIAERITRFGAQYYDFGRLSGSLPEPNVMVIVHTGVPAYVHPWYEPMHVSYIEECMRLLGAKDGRAVSHHAVLDGTKDGFALVTARTELRWTR